MHFINLRSCSHYPFGSETKSHPGVHYDSLLLHPKILVVLLRNLLSYSDTSDVSSLDVVWITHRSRSNTPQTPLRFCFSIQQPSGWLIGPVSQKRTKGGQLKKTFPRWWSCRIVWKYLPIFQRICSPIFHVNLSSAGPKRSVSPSFWDVSFGVFFVTEIHGPSWKLLSPRSGVSSLWLQKIFITPGMMNSEIQKNLVVLWKSNPAT